MGSQKKARANNEGSVYFHIAKQKWCVQVTVGYDEETGRIQRTTKYCDSQKEALALQ